MNRVRTEVTVGSGIQNQSATSAYLNPKIVMLYQFSDVAELGASVEEKIFAAGVYQMRAAFIAFGNLMIRSNQFGSTYSEHVLIYKVPF